MSDRNDKMYFTDDLEEIAQESMALASGQRGRDLDPWTSPFARLAKGKTVGKRSVLLLQAVGQSFAAAPIDMLEIRGEDNDAMQIGLTLTPPHVLPTAGLVLPANTQQITGERDSESIQGAPAFVWGMTQAIVEWGIGGVSCRADVDFHNGLAVNLQASWLRVRGTLQNDLGVGITQAAYVLGCFAGPAHAAPARAQLTQQLSDVGGGGSFSILRSIPRFAKEMQVFAVGDLATNDFSIQFDRSNTPPNLVATQRYLAAAGSSPYFPSLNSKTLIPAEAYYYRIQNNSPAALRFVTVFDLAI